MILSFQFIKSFGLRHYKVCVGFCQCALLAFVFVVVYAGNRAAGVEHLFDFRFAAGLFAGRGVSRAAISRNAISAQSSARGRVTPSDANVKTSFSSVYLGKFSPLSFTRREETSKRSEVADFNERFAGLQQAERFR